MPIRPQSAKAKGRNLQKWVRDEILSRFDQLEPDDVKSTSMGASGEDVQLSPAARRLAPYSFECKARSKIAVYEWLQQAADNAGKHEPALIIKADRKQPLAVISASHFFDLLKRSHSAPNG